ncbi:MAG: 1-deoxy-D-xylulose-5-phosphate reductoisomerase [Bacteroidetes bacterium]|nr:MAG: 1-deoxy-D-xylulose-5-phosphate reductoisomerase [Bacteroidota bacterium]
MKKRIAILGSTGSVGTQTLSVIDEQHEFLSAEVLTANNNTELLIKQAIKYLPNVVVIGNSKHYTVVSDALSNYDIKVYAGEDAICQIMEMDTIDIVLMGIVGFGALKPILAALENKKKIALANKESLVVAGEIISKAAIYNNTQIIPVDSEHSAIFQCLMGEFDNPIEKIVLTASGGPFREKDISYLKNVTPTEALNHPNWKMGKRVSIDSATLMNKGLEAIEAHWLFNIPPANIEIIIHPQSVIHSLVYFKDKSVKTLLSFPDMRIPIQFALSYPQRLPSTFPDLDLLKINTLNFERPDVKKFRNLALAFKAMEIGGNMPCILNAANDVAVSAFLNKKIGFQQITDVIEKSMHMIPLINKPVLTDYIETDNLTRIKANELIAES